MYLFAARRAYSKILFALMAVHSYISAFVLYGTYDRPATFLGYADLYCALFFLINAQKRPRRELSANRKRIWAAIALVSTLACVACIRFGALYAVVEFRPYIMALLMVLTSRACKLKFNVEWLNTLVWPFWIAEFLFIATNYALKANKLGIFGEMNYDVQFIVLVLTLKHMPIKLRHIAFAVVAKTTTFLIFTTGFWSASRRSFKLFFFSAVPLLFLLFYVDYISVDLLQSHTQDLDRIFIAQRFVDIVSNDDSNLFLCGQLFCGGLLYDVPLSWYIETQRLSSTLNSVVPAVFHGHILRNMFLLGVPLAIFGYALLISKLARRDGTGVLIAWILVSGNFAIGISSSFCWTIVGIFDCRDIGAG